ncbi:alpha beta hydrolase domain-containing 11 [Brachionus plicatilis]|uniref:sn-1-specific diacylglycerol lipase ABHD11 n=1 Tax=Brachionus plicatilis TaxID=10195 RepID=A0A3M7QEP2_BRAPC|nr:alpha beta hydrolase domain-containing 11 [Brachionus plicatilis]
MLGSSKINFRNAFLTCYLTSRKYSTKPFVNLSYELNDKYKSSQALVIAHGLFASKENWRSLAKRINDLTKLKVYTVDLRNHGDSRPYMPNMTYIDMANDLENFVNKIVIEKGKVDHITLMGHSMGGKTVMSLALKEIVGPLNVDQIIVADISPNVSPSLINIKSYLEKMKSIDMNSVGQTLIQARKEIDKILCDLPNLKKDVHQRQFILTRLKEENGNIRWNFNLDAIMTHYQDIMNFPAFKNQYHNPALFLGGERSDYITEKDLPEVEKYFTYYKFVKIPRAGHVIHFDNPTATLNAIKNFICF